MPLYSGTADEWCYVSTDVANSPFTMEMIVDNFEYHMINANDIKSHQFKVGGILFHVKVSADGKDKEEKGFIGVFLVNDSDEEVTASFKCKNGDRLLDFSDKKVNNDLGFPKFMTSTKCRANLDEGKFILKVEILVVNHEQNIIQGRRGKPYNMIPDNTNSEVNSSIFEAKSFTDFCIKCKDKTFPCHKAFLSARSSVFKTMFESNMKEVKEATVRLDSYTETVTEGFVKFFYTGQLEEKVLEGNATSFLDLGEQYDIESLKVIAEEGMIANLDTGNMLSYFLAGELYRGEKIRSAAKTFLRQNRRSLVEQERWKETLKGKTDMVLELLESFSRTQI